jgi:uncharacterized protein with PQ loop repeat
MIGTVCVTLALALDSASYWKQIIKILRTKRSKDVSSSSYILKIGKAVIAAVGLATFANYAGLVMELVMLAVYVASLVIICRYKPRGWKLWN